MSGHEGDDLVEAIQEDLQHAQSPIPQILAEIYWTARRIEDALGGINRDEVFHLRKANEVLSNKLRFATNNYTERNHSGESHD